jgi:hypothetical protein
MIRQWASCGAGAANEGIVMKLIADPEFKKAVAIAKSIQQALGSPKLTIRSILLGSLLADATGDLSNCPAIKLHNEELRALAGSEGVDLSRTYAPVEGASMPLAQDLKSMLATHSETPFDAFFMALLGADQAERSTKQEGKTAKADIESLPDDAFALIESYAAAAAHSLTLESLTPELFVVAALAASDQGALQHRRSVAMHVTQNRQNIEALISAREWGDIATVSPSPEVKPPKFSPDFQKTLNNASGAPAPLMTLLNVGISAGLSLRLKQRVAYHEAGHAFISWALRPELGIVEVTLIRKGNADGATIYDEASPWMKWPDSREMVMDRLCVALAGRVSEQAKFGHDAADAGATADLEDATHMAWKAITVWGLDETFGPICLDVLSKKSGIHSGFLFDEAQHRLQTLLQEANAKTEGLVRANTGKIEAIATALLKKDRLTGDEVLEIIGG